MSNKRILVTGALAGSIAASAVATLANGAADPGTPTLPPTVAQQLTGSGAAQILGANTRTRAAGDGVSRVEGNGQVCSVAAHRILACGPNKDLDEAPVVDVSIADGGKLAVSFLSSTDVSSIGLTDSKGVRQSVALTTGIGRAAIIPPGDFTIAWKTADGRSHTDTVPAAKMFAPGPEVETD